MDSAHVPLSPIFLLQRKAPSSTALKDIHSAIQHALSALQLPSAKIRGKRIAVTVGSRGIDRLPEIVRAICFWLNHEGATPFVVPAMGSHGGATAEGQRRVLEQYGVTPEFIGAEIRSSIEPMPLGSTPEGIEVFMDRNA